MCGGQTCKGCRRETRACVGQCVNERMLETCVHVGKAVALMLCLYHFATFGAIKTRFWLVKLSFSIAQMCIPPFGEETTEMDFFREFRFTLLTLWLGLCRAGSLNVLTYAKASRPLGEASEA
jgi:hypothetical protein